MSTRAELEAAVAAAPDERAGYAVLGDALASAGDPRGELIALQLAAEAAEAKPAAGGKPSTTAKKLRAAADKHFAAHARAFLGPLAPQRNQLAWRAGYIRRLELDESDQVTAGALAARVLAHPSGRFLVELAAEVERRGEADELLAALVAAAPRALRSLELVARGRPELADVVGPGPHPERLGLDLSELIPRIPWLEQLAVTAPGIELGAAQLPAARRVKLHAATLTASCMHAIAAAPWPALERLELRFVTRADAPATFADVRPLLHRTDLPALTHLRLRNSPFAGGILRELLRTPLTRQLAVLDLSHGSMSPADAAALVADPAPVAHLRELWLPMRLLRAVDRAALEALGKHVIEDTRGPADALDSVLGY